MGEHSESSDDRVDLDVDPADAPAEAGTGWGGQVSRWEIAVTWRRAAMTLALLGVACVGLLVLSRAAGLPGRSEPAVVTPTPDALTVEVPDTVAFGLEIPVTIEGVAPRQLVTVTLDAGYGPRRISTLADSATITIDVPPSTTPESGLISVMVEQGGAIGMASYEQLPGDAVDPTPVFLGPRTVIADSRHRTMIVAVPTDAIGNPVQSDTGVLFGIELPGGPPGLSSVETSDLLAFLEIWSTTLAGPAQVSTDVGGAGAPGRSYLQVAGPPVPTEVAVVGEPVVADGRSLMTIASARLFDRYGNELPDGVTAHLDVDGATGRRRLQTETIDGLAEFVLEAPAQPGAVTAALLVGGVIGPELEVDIGPAVVDVPFVVKDSGLTVGPVRQVNGAYVPDGTPVAVEAGDGSAVTAETELGVAEFARDDLGSGPRRIVVLGASGEATLP